MNFYIFTIILVILASSIGILIGGVYEKKGVPQKAIVTFSAPDGSRRQGQLDTTWSWTVLVFGQWALLFRGQFMDFLILWISRWILIGAGAMVIITTQTGIAYETVLATPLEDVFKQMSTLSIIGWVALWGIWLSIRIYFVAFANKRRLITYNARGFDFSQTPNLGALYEYMGIVPRTPQSELKPDQRAGQTHDYVVPEQQVKEEKEDYSTLTINDLKLLLKSEGVAFDSKFSKEELLKLVDKHIVEK